MFNHGKHFPKKVPKKKRLTHHAVVNILDVYPALAVGILIQPCFTDSVALTTQIHPDISNLHQWSPKSDTSQTEYDNHQWVQYREFRFAFLLPHWKA